MKYVLKRISIIPTIKVCATLHAILGILIGLLYGGVLLIMAGVSMMGGSSAMTAGMGLAASLLTAIGLPIAGFIMGAIHGAIFSFLYNFIADFIGGFEINLVEKEEKQKKDN